MGYQIIEPTAGSTDWTDLSVIINNMMQGFMSLSLTNYDTTGDPSIAAGSQIEVAGSLFTFASTETISGTSNPSTSNINYIMVTTSSSSITASLSTDAPTWVPSKSGWYDSSTGSIRYIGGMGINSGGKWTYGHTRPERSDTVSKVIDIGDWDMNTASNVTVAHNLGSNWTNIRNITVIVRSDDESLYGPLIRWFNSIGGVTQGSLTSFGPDTIALQRLDSGIYDSTMYEATSFNRGWIYIDYIA